MTETAVLVALALLAVWLAYLLPKEELMAEEGRWPTAEEWRDKFLSLTPDGQMEIAARVLMWAQDAERCFLQDHASAIEHLRELELRVAGVDPG